MVIVEQAYAKVNFTLEVIRKRDDGFHDLASIIQTVDLYDELQFTERDGIEFECSEVSLNGEENLVVRAARALRDETGFAMGARIVLRKRIPVAGGLGGGSADAAATLRGLNRLWRLNLAEQDLVDIAAKVGSDVPFLVSGGTAFVSGRGERLDRLPTPDIGRIVVVSPKLDTQSSDQSKTERIGHDARIPDEETGGANVGWRRLSSLFHVQCFSAGCASCVSGLAGGI